MGNPDDPPSSTDGGTITVATSPVPLFLHYGDESNVPTSTGLIRAQGYVTLPASMYTTIISELSAIRANAGPYGEMKWNKCKRDKPPEIVSRSVEYFMSCASLSYTSIVVSDDVDPTWGLDPLTQDLGYYKTFHTLMSFRFQRTTRNAVFLDWRHSLRPAPAGELMTCLNATSRKHARGYEVTKCNRVSSVKTPLVQVADLLTGAVAWAYAGQKGKPAKAAIHDYICQCLGWKTLRRNTGPNDTKFRIWRYQPSASKKKAG